MKVGIISDTHDNMPMLKQGVERLQQEGAEVLLHAGDIIAPFAAKLLLDFNGPVYAVFGNNDGEKKGLKGTGLDITEPPRLLELGGRKIVMAHSRDQVGDMAKEADVVISGHTHKAGVEQGKPCYINPGECAGWLTGRRTVAMLDTESLEARIIDIEKGEALF